MLVSLRQWKHVWLQSRTVITVKADNIAALTLVASMKARRGPMSVVAREMALDVACGLYSPSVAVHLPGVVNESADALSRRHQPGKTFVLPFLLEQAKERLPDNRTSDWWRSITAKHGGVTWGNSAPADWDRFPSWGQLSLNVWLFLLWETSSLGGLSPLHGRAASSLRSYVPP